MDAPYSVVLGQFISIPILLISCPQGDDKQLAPSRKRKHTQSESEEEDEDPEVAEIERQRYRLLRRAVKELVFVSY